MANPVAALFEWARAVRHGGILYLVVPDRRYTFDHTRDLTPPEHLMEDFARGTTFTDGTHISDYLDRLDWTRWNPDGTPEQNEAKREELRRAYTAAVASGQEINIHFHVFEPTNLSALVGMMNGSPQRPGRFEVVELAERFPQHCPNGFLLVLRVHKPWRARLAGWWARRRSRGDPSALLAASAKPLAP
jgi:hypothetical protein